MKQEIIIDDLGTLTVSQNAWTGGISYELDGKKFTKISKQRYELAEGEKVHEIYVSGNFFKGIKITLGANEYQITSPLAWYCYVLAFIPVVLALTLGNIPAVARAGFYFVGGALGGAIGGLATGLNLYVGSLMMKKWYFKVLFMILIDVLAVLVLWGLGTALVAALTK